VEAGFQRDKVNALHNLGLESGQHSFLKASFWHLCDCRCETSETAPVNSMTSMTETDPDYAIARISYL
jgi:hypothetical protein